MLTTIHRSSLEQGARGWTTRLGALIFQLRRMPSEREPERPSWRHFDETHHWDATAEEWVPNQDR